MFETKRTHVVRFISFTPTEVLVHIFGETLATGAAVFLALALLLALSFEFVNGFHDTANAVATVIYTHSLPATVAVVWSGCWNLIGVLTSTGAVAFGVIALLPVELVVNVGSAAGFAMVFALLISAIIWNLGTWYFGLPASSSHTLIGSIMGVGLANSVLMPGHIFGEGVNWAKAKEVGASLLISPLIGFTLAALLLLLCKALIKRPELYAAPEKDQPPPPWVRGLLILTCTGVSFAHGSNDGQKGMGLVMLIMIGILPGAFAVRMDNSPAVLHHIVASADSARGIAQRHANSVTMAPTEATAAVSAYLRKPDHITDTTFAAVAALTGKVADDMRDKENLASLTTENRRTLRTELYLSTEALGKLDKAKKFDGAGEHAAIADARSGFDTLTRFIPTWVKVAVALALGLGTMIGWKRIVVTVGEKIGKEHLTYAQGASAELVAMTTIGAADYFGLPVSTTHVLSSGIAGTMAANHSGIQMDTMRNLLLAWVLTLPVCVFLGALTFSGGLFLVFNVLGLR